MLVSHQVRSLPCLQSLVCRDLTHGPSLLALQLALGTRGCVEEEPVAARTGLGRSSVVPLASF